jgi:hypothetical protein
MSGINERIVAVAADRTFSEGMKKRRREGRRKEHQGREEEY